MTPHQELTFMPRLTHEYELTDSDILPKDYATFLVECAQIYVNQSYPDLKKDDEFFQPNFNFRFDFSRHRACSDHCFEY